MDRRHARGIPSRPLVLIVEDHDDTRELYVASLAALGFDAIAAGDCAQAYRQARESHPDIVVTDLTLRDADGWQLIQDLKREPRTRSIAASCSLATQRQRCANVPSVRAVRRSS
jgi:CheY-like chemotaxis protein